MGAFVLWEVGAADDGKWLRLWSLVSDRVDDADQVLLGGEGLTGVERASSWGEIDELSLLTEFRECLLGIANSSPLSWEELTALRLCAAKRNPLLASGHACSWPAGASSVNIPLNPNILYTILITTTNDRIFIIGLVLYLSVASKTLPRVIRGFRIHFLEFFSLMLGQVQSWARNDSFLLTF